MSVDQYQDKRTQCDRREAPTGLWAAFTSDGQRTLQRRLSEHCRQYFVDRFSVLTLVFVVLLLAFSILDAVITIDLLDDGYHEVNPLLRRLLNKGLLPFLLGKYGLTAIGLPFLLVFHKHFLFGTRFRVGYLIPVFVGAYALLLSYQLGLLHASASLEDGRLSTVTNSSRDANEHAR
ncbi:MAG: hypothetical protein HY000_24705 [Planctomycetes bacterium]|nr:hypothetical protein [Planctomycetota bacterium]